MRFVEELAITEFGRVEILDNKDALLEINSSCKRSEVDEEIINLLSNSENTVRTLILKDFSCGRGCILLIYSDKRMLDRAHNSLMKLGAVLAENVLHIVRL